jgi:hypothetical protein
LNWGTLLQLELKLESKIAGSQKVLLDFFTNSETNQKTAGTDTMAKYIIADPYPYPYDGDLRPENTCVIVIDMQADFCEIGGYVDKMGYDLSLTRAPIAPIAAVLAACHAQGYSIMHTRCPARLSLRMR